MKKIISLLVCIALLLGLAACGASREETEPESSEPVAEQKTSAPQPEQTAATTLPTQPEQTEAPETQPEQTQTPAVQPLPESCTAQTLVWDYLNETLEWVDGVGNENKLLFAIPQIYPFSEDAIACQEEILELLMPIYEESLQNIALECSCVYGAIGYEAYLWGDVLSILVYRETHFDLTDYSVYNLNVRTGQRLDNGALLEQIGLSQESYMEAAAQAAHDAFAGKYGQLQEAFGEEYDTQLANTISQENISAAQLYLNGEGTLMMAVNIYSMAGAAYYPALLALPVVCTGEAAG